jgi:two-component system nitrogen regulation response regulator NtrX
VAINCGAIPEHLIESELFGHVRGAFTGAVVDRAGCFRGADGGSIFLDEIGDLPLHLQVKLLRVLQERVFRPVGSETSVAVNVRVLAASNRDLTSEVAAGAFREDLFYRLNVITIELPPLRERREDIPLLISHFLQVLSRNEGMPPKSMAPEAVERLQSLEWAGNVRELRNTIERLMILSGGPRIGVDDVARLVGRRDGEHVGLGALLECKTFDEFKQAAERAFLVAKLREFDWNVSETARALDMPRSNLYKKIERYALTRES